MCNPQPGWCTFKSLFTIAMRLRSSIMSKNNALFTHKILTVAAFYTACVKPIAPWPVKMSLIYSISIMTKKLNSINISISPTPIGRPVKPGTASAAALQSPKTPLFALFHNPGKNSNPKLIGLIMFRIFATILIQLQRQKPLGLSKRTIDYTQTLTFFPTALASPMVLVFLMAIN